MKRFFYFLFFVTASITWNACVDDDFDEPPVDGQDPNITATHTIEELKEMHELGQLERIGIDVFAGEEVIIEALVVSEDAEGNFFRQMYLQDATAGIEIRVDATDLSTRFPVGRKVFVRCNGLWLGDFNSLIQLGFGPETEVDNSGNIDTTGLGRLPEVLIDDYIVPGSLNNEVQILSLTLSDLFATITEEILVNRVGRLVEFQDIEFSVGDLNQTLADADNNQSINRELVDCDGNTLTIRTSGFADFAGEVVPGGNGTVTGILGVFNTGGNLDPEDDLQITIRNTADLDMMGDRCTEGGVTGDQLTISSLREDYASGSSQAEAGFIQGIVISDGASGNIVGQNLVLQDGTAGIVVRFTDSHSFSLGQEIKVGVEGQELSDFNGLVQVNNVPLGNVELVGAGTLPSPRVTDVSTLLANADDWESTLVRINGVQLSGGSTFGGSLTITDGSGSIPMFTRNAASFSGESVPTNSIDLVGIVSDFDGSQINIRNLDDIMGGNQGGGDDSLGILELRQAFNSGSSSAPSGFVVGTVISDADNMNTTDRNMVIQDGNAGIVVRFSNPHSIPLGSVVQVNVSGEELSEFNGLTQVNNVALSNAQVLSSGDFPEPIVVELDDLLTDFETYESRLIRVNMAQLSGSSTFEDDLTVTDGTGSITMFTRSAATFADQGIPGGMVDLVAIASEFNEPQIVIRNLSDVIE